MEFLLLREVQLVTPAAPTPSIYCLKAKPACAGLNTTEPRYEAVCWNKRGGGGNGEVTTALTTHAHPSLPSIFFIFFTLLTLFRLLNSLICARSYCRHPPTQTQAAVGQAQSVVSSSLVRPGSLIKAPNEAACIKHEAPRAAVMNCCSIIASQSRKMKTKYLKRDSVTSLQKQH